MLCMKVKRVNPKSFHHTHKNYYTHTQKLFFHFFNFVWDDGCLLDLLW